MAVQLISQADYARQRNVDPTTVRDAIKAGRITTVAGPDGRPMIDPAVADIQWQRNTRARVSAKPRQQRLDDGALAPAGSSYPTGGNASGQATADTGGESDYWVSRARRERAEAELAELKLAEQMRDLVRKAEVTKEVGQLAAGLRDALLQIDARLAPLVAVETDLTRCQALIREEIRNVLMTLTPHADGAADGRT